MADKDNVKTEEVNKTEEKWEHSDEEKEENKENKEENQNDDKPVYQAPSYKKDKLGNVIIDKLDDYVEPPKTIKAASNNEFNNQVDMFEGIQVEIDNDDDNNTNTNSDLGSILVNNKPKSKKVAKNQDNLDDLLKEFGIEQKENEESKTQKPKKVKEVKEVKEKVEKKVEPKVETTDKTEEKKEAPKKKVVKKVTNDKSHLNDARREILERQEALKKKDKKK